MTTGITLVPSNNCLCTAAVSHSKHCAKNWPSSCRCLPAHVQCWRQKQRSIFRSRERSSLCAATTPASGADCGLPSALHASAKPPAMRHDIQVKALDKYQRKCGTGCECAVIICSPGGGEFRRINCGWRYSGALSCVPANIVSVGQMTPGNWLCGSWRR